MNLNYSLQLLLAHELPRMTAEGEARFRRLMEEAIRNVVLSAFTPEELNSWRVETMLAQGGAK